MCDYEYKSHGKKEKCFHRNIGETVVINGKYKQFCIFHTPVLERKGKEFWDEFFIYIEELKQKKSKIWDFEGFIFPEIENRFFDVELPEDITIDLSFSIFEERVDFSRKTLKCKLIFNNCIFKKTSLFIETEFKNNVEFHVAKFIDLADFSEAKFHRESKFINVEFEKQVRFCEVIFDDNVDFSWSKFHKEANFNGRNNITNFHKDAIFDATKFFENVNFESISISGKASFLCVEFKKDSRFSSSEFNEITFNSVTFSGETFFVGTIFNKKTEFHNIKFLNFTKFDLSHFNEYTEFLNCIFFKNTNFIGTIFEYPINFISIEFKEYVYFQYSKFFRELSFYRVIFFSYSNFYGIWIKSIYFQEITSYLPISLEGLIASNKNVEIKSFVGNKINFVSGYLPKRVGFDEPFNLKIKDCIIDNDFSIKTPLNILNIFNTSFEGKFNVSPVNNNLNTIIIIKNSYFKENSLIENSKIYKFINCIITKDFILKNVNLIKTSFEDTFDLRKIDFINVEWAKKDRSKIQLLFTKINILKRFKFSLINIDAIYDEKKGKILQRKIKRPLDNSINVIIERKLKKLSEMYRAVSTSYESRHRYGSAGPFKVGEFEMRRMMKETSKIEKCVLYLYRLVSSYGESAIKPFFLIILTIFIPAMLYYFHGFYEPKLCKGIITYNYINYDWSISSFYSIDNLLNAIKDFGRAFLFSFQATISIWSEKIGQLTGWLSYLPSIQRLLSIIFTALFLFALRRKVKR